MLVEAHGPERHHLRLRVRIQLGQLLQPAALGARHLDRLVQRVRCDEGGEILEADRLAAVRILRVLRLHFQGMLRPQAVADVLVAALEGGVPADEVPVDFAAADDVVGDVVEDCLLYTRCV